MILVATKNMPPWTENYILNVQTDTTPNSLNQAGRKYTKQYYRTHEL